MSVETDISRHSSVVARKDAALSSITRTASEPAARRTGGLSQCASSTINRPNATAFAHLVMIGRVEGLFRCRSDFRVVVDGEVGMDYGARIEEGTGCASTTAAST